MTVDIARTVLSRLRPLGVRCTVKTSHDGIVIHAHMPWNRDPYWVRDEMDAVWLARELREQRSEMAA